MDVFFFPVTATVAANVSAGKRATLPSKVFMTPRIA